VGRPIVADAVNSSSEDGRLPPKELEAGAIPAEETANFPWAIRLLMPAGVVGSSLSTWRNQATVYETV